MTATVREGSLDRLARIDTAAEEVATCKDALDAAQERLRELTRQAIDDGVSWRVAARAAHRSKTWVHEEVLTRAASA